MLKEASRNVLYARSAFKATPFNEHFKIYFFMSCYLVYYKNGAKMMRPVQSREEYVGLRNKPSNVDYTKQARLGNPEAKRKMLQFCYSCLPGADGKLKGAKTASNSVGMDIDLAPSNSPKGESNVGAGAKRSLHSPLGETEGADFRCKVTTSGKSSDAL